MRNIISSVSDEAVEELSNFLTAALEVIQFGLRTKILILE